MTSSRFVSQAHPRVCGENRAVAWTMFSTNGSSPRVRGKPFSKFAEILVPRLIPACAGKTKRRYQRPVNSRAHPRVCGENRVLPKNLLSPSGSSPRVRGKREERFSDTCREGLIPACAGKTMTRSTWITHMVAHPRVCGENEHCVLVGFVVAGSSPRVRGKQIAAFFQFFKGRLIPACAGKTLSPITSP